MGSLVARRLKAEGCCEIRVINRADMHGLVPAIAKADIVVTSTGAQTFVLTVNNVADAMRTRPSRPMFIVDIAVPRDCDPDVAQIEGVSVVDVDGLRGVIDVTLERRREAIPMVEEIIAEHTERFHNWYQSRVAVPVISSLVQRAESLRERELERLFARCPELTERERMLITGMSLTIISKLLHSAITKIRDKAIVNRAEALTDAHILNDLFDLRAPVLEETALRMLPEAEDARE
jgi:glutamyl-tRNA reductase